MYQFREEKKPRFDLKFSSLIALVLMLLLGFLTEKTTLFQISAEELQKIQEEQAELSREMVFRFSDAPEEEVENEDAKFASDANRKERAPTQDAPNEDPDPVSEGNSYELENAPNVVAQTQPPQPVTLQQPKIDPLTPEEQKDGEDEAKDIEEALPDEPKEVEADRPEPERETEKDTKETETTTSAEGLMRLPEDAPKPYRKLSKDEILAARQQALKEMNLRRSVPQQQVEGSRYHNPKGSGAPNIGLTVETNRNDMGPYLRILKQLIKGNWRIPNIAKFEVAGVTGISFKIHKDGSFSDVRVMLSSHHEPLDVAALNAINTTQAPPLPKHVDEEFVPIKFGFYYNTRPQY